MILREYDTIIFPRKLRDDLLSIHMKFMAIVVSEVRKIWIISGYAHTKILEFLDSLRYLGIAEVWDIFLKCESEDKDTSSFNLDP